MHDSSYLSVDVTTSCGDLDPLWVGKREGVREGGGVRCYKLLHMTHLSSWVNLGQRRVHSLLLYLARLHSIRGRRVREMREEGEGDE